MATIKNLNAKVLEEKLKHNWTTSQFAEYFQCTEAEFISALNKSLSSHAARGMISRLKRNDKRSKKLDSSEKFVEIENTIDFKDKDVEAIIPLEEESCSEEVFEEIHTEESLESLKSKQAELQAWLNDLELQHKKSTSDRAQIRTLIASYKDRLAALFAEVHKCKTDISSLIDELNSKQDLMKFLNLEISETRKSLEHINMSIEIMQKISIFIYTSSNFEVEMPSGTLAIEATDWSNFFDIIVKDEEAGSLTINQIKGIAKALALSEFLNSQKLNYEITFEEESSERFFKKYNGG